MPPKTSLLSTPSAALSRTGGRGRSPSPAPGRRGSSPAPSPARGSRAAASPAPPARSSVSKPVERPSSRSTDRPKREKEAEKEAVREKVKKKFKELDKDGDGTLEIDELVELFQGAQKTKLSDKEIRILFDKVDKNKDGRVDFEEFVDYIWSTDDDDGAEEIATIAVTLPLDPPGGGLLLGGKLGNVVVKPGFNKKLKVGWRALGINGIRKDPAELVKELENNKRKRIRTTLEFELDELTNSRILGEQQDRRQAAMQELLGMLGCEDVSQIANISQEKRSEIMQDKRVMKLLVDAHAVKEADLLFNGMSPDDLRKQERLQKAIDEDNHQDLCSLLSGSGEIDKKALLRQDGDGNVALHWARSASVVSALLRVAPEAQKISNNAGKNPLNERLINHPESVTVSEIVSCGDALTFCDAKGICPAMRTEDEHFSAAQESLPPWEALSAALGRETEDIVPALVQLGGDNWPGLLGFHCFHDAVVDSAHSITTWTRLRLVWDTMSRLFQQCMAHRKEALEPLKMLLRATKGPCCPPVDMRLPYREDLLKAMDGLDKLSGTTLNTEYSKLKGDGADWLKHTLQDGLSTDLAPDYLVSKVKGLKGDGDWVKPRLRMDFKLQSGEEASPSFLPEWILDPVPDIYHQVRSDLLKVGMIGKSKPENATYDMLRLGGMGQDEDGDTKDNDGAVLTRLYGAYIRGVCQKHQGQVKGAVQALVGELARPGETMFARPEAKGFPRICVKTQEALIEVRHELKTLGVEVDDEIAHYLRRSSAYVNDINGVTLVGDKPEDLKLLYEKIQAGSKIVRTKNTYGLHAEVADYRDIKVWPCVQTDQGLMLVEVQLILASSFEEKKWMHLPYTFNRGDFDWPYTRDCLSAEDYFRAGWRLYHGIDGEQDKGSLDKAKKALVDSAKMGHFMARGLCYKEGWGGYKMNESKTMEDFRASADLGRREAKCRIGISLVNSVTNVGVNMERGLAILREAAAEGEPEACYQLGNHELDIEDQREWLEKAKKLGHMRAAKHPLLCTLVFKKTSLRNLDV